MRGGWNMCMRLMTVLIASSLLMAIPARAEVLVAQSDNIPNDGKLTLTLPAGPVDIAMNTAKGTGLIVKAGGSQNAMFDTPYMPRLLKTYRNSALLELATGGNACPILYGWITYDAKGLRASDDFGTCAEDARYEETKEGPVVSMEDLHKPGHVVNYLYQPATNTLSEIKR